MSNATTGWKLRIERFPSPDISSIDNSFADPDLQNE
jgi:hypothetical protein